MKHPLQRRWIFLAFLSLRALVRWLPLRVVQAFGACLGLVAYGLLARYRRLSWSHLRRAFGPSLSDATCYHIARRVFINLGKTAAEWFVFERLSPAQIRRVVDIHGLVHLRQALMKRRGVIAVSGHFGNWELLSVALRSIGFEGGVLARRLRYPEYEQFLWTLRARFGVATYERGSVKDVVRVLRANGIIGVVPDQDVDSLDGVFVEFFGQPAYTPVGPAALALMTGAPLVPCFCVRDGRRFRVVIEDPILITGGEDRARDLVELTQAWSRVVESYIRRHPDQWAWMHRRWKTQPVTRSSAQPRDVVTRQARPRNAVLQPALSGVLFAVGCLFAMVPVGCMKSPAPKAQKPVAIEPNQPSEVLPAQADRTAPPSQQMDGFTMDGYAPDGTKHWELKGTAASVEGSVVSIHAPHAVGFSPERTAYLTASMAQVEQTSRRVHLEHDVTIHTSEGLWLTSPTMYWLPDKNEMITEQPVRLETDHMLLHGRGATGHSQLKHAVIERDIELVLNPTSSEETPSTGPSHVRITCDGPLSFDYEQNIATFEHNVHVVDHQGDLYSDKLIAYLDHNSRTIRYAEALGRVRIVQGLHTATSERAVYEPAHAKVTLLGSPSLLLYPDGDQTPVLSASFGGLADASSSADAKPGRTVEPAGFSPADESSQASAAASRDSSKPLSTDLAKGP